MIDGLSAYSSYRDTGAPWLGELPEHWGTHRLKTVFREVDQRSGSGAEPLLTLRMREGLVDNREVGGKPIPAASLAHYKIATPDELVMNRMRAATGLFGVAPKTGLVSPDYAVLRPRQPVDLRYFLALFQTPAMMSVFRMESRGLGTGEAGFLRLYTERFGMIAAPLPPPDEQAAIVKFLGHANGRIRRYIQAKLKLIKLLEEQKQVIIHRAVTRGVDPSARLKPSGIEWLGDVPDHWEVRRLKTLFREVNKRSDTGAETLLSLRMYQGLVPHADVSDKPIPASALIGYKQVTPGQLVMNRMRAAIGIFGVPSQEGLVSPDYAVFDPADTVIPSYYLSLFKTAAMCSEFRMASKGLGTGSSGFMRLYTDQFGRLWVPLPPCDEQETILKAIAVDASEIESALSLARRELDLLREYRTRLTADVVTGQLDVREAASKLPDPPMDLEMLDDGIDVEGDDFNEDEGMES